MFSESQINKAAKLYKIRNTLHRFFGHEYHDKVKPYQHIIRQVMEANKIEELPALIEVTKTKTFQESSEIVQLMFIAAAVELIEPSVQLPTPPYKQKSMFTI